MSRKSRKQHDLAYRQARLSGFIRKQHQRAMLAAAKPGARETIRTPIREEYDQIASAKPAGGSYA